VTRSTSVSGSPTAPLKKYYSIMSFLVNPVVIVHSAIPGTSHRHVRKNPGYGHYAFTPQSTVVCSDFHYHPIKSIVALGSEYRYVGAATAQPLMDSQGVGRQSFSPTIGSTYILKYISEPPTRAGSYDHNKYIAFYDRDHNPNQVAALFARGAAPPPPPPIKKAETAKGTTSTKPAPTSASSSSSSSTPKVSTGLSSQPPPAPSPTSRRSKRQRGEEMEE